MERKIIKILICVMLIIAGSLTTVIVSNDIKVEAASGGSGGIVGLDYNFILSLVSL
jgi:hypothetical protein